MTFVLQRRGAPSGWWVAFQWHLVRVHECFGPLQSGPGIAATLCGHGVAQEQRDSIKTSGVNADWNALREYAKVDVQWASTVEAVPGGVKKS